MKDKILISIFVSGIAFGIFIIIGITGITDHIFLEVNGCKQSYLHYYIAPYVRDYFECLNRTPCGVAPDITTHNAQVEILSCLCQDIVNNRDVIVHYYNNEMLRFHHEPKTDDVAFICNDVYPVMRL